MSRFIHYILPLFLLLTSGTLLQANDEDRLNRDTWRESTKDVDYLKGLEEKKEEPPAEEDEEPIKQKEERWNWDGFNISENFVQIIVFGLLIILLAFIIYRILGNAERSVGNGLDKNLSYSFEELEEYIHETELEKYLRHALENNDYKAALRVYYLMIIKSLSEKEFIHWKKDKTNADYLREMRTHEAFKSFQKTTFIFELVWYGEITVSKKDYDSSSPLFSSLLKEIEPNE